MTHAAPARRMTLVRILLLLALAAAVAVILFPAAVAGGAGRLIGDLWVSVMGAIVGLFGG